MTIVMGLPMTAVRCVRSSPSLASYGMNTPRYPLAVRALLTVVALFAAEACGLLGSFAGTIGVSVAVAAGGLGIAVLLVRVVDRRPVSALGLDRAAVRGCLTGLAVVATAVAVATLLAVAFGLTEAPSTRHVSALILVQAFVLQGFPEEVLFRGYLVQTATGRLPRKGMIALSVLLFGVLHLVSSSGAQTMVQRLLFLLIPIGFALIATLLRLATGSVWPAVAVHGGFHLSVYAAGLWVTPSPATYGIYLALFGGTLLTAGAALAFTRRRKVVQCQTASA